MSPRALLLAVSSAVGLLAARALDGTGVLPGVVETAQVRHAALDPRVTALGLLGCVLVGLVAARLHRLRPALAVGTLVAGQLVLVPLLEETGRAVAGAPHEHGTDTGLWVATAVQVAIAVLAVATVLLVLPPGQGCAPVTMGIPDAQRSAYRGVEGVGGVEPRGGRGPPPPAGPRPIPRPSGDLMHTTALRRGLAAATLVPLLAGLSACGDGDKDKEAAKNASKPCATLPTADPTATLPTGFPTRDQVLYNPMTQGKTKIVYALVGESSFLAVRDDLVTRLKAAKYTVDSTDQESVEAEAEFSGPQKGSIKVLPFCAGHVSVRYKFLG